MLRYHKRQTANNQGFAMLAPLWTDNDARYGDVYYHIYDLTMPGSTATDQARVKHIIDHARDDVIKNGGVSVTDVTWVLVITWSHMIPRMYYSRYDSPNTFQLVIAYDPSRYQTFVMYVYKDMGWDNEITSRRIMLGYLSYRHAVEESLQLGPSMKSTAFRLHTRTGNTGEVGRYMFRVASGRNDINYDQKCYNWFASEMRRIVLVRDYWSWTVVCPCDLRLAMMDGRWTFDWRQYFETKFNRLCIYERVPQEQSSQECCYSPFGSLINTEDGRGGQTFLYHPRYARQHQKYDVLPKQWCCQFSDNCQYFYRVRPLDHCWGYTPLSIGWLYGDPHIRTLDGFQYTFNGLGEYTLIETSHGNFTLQGRTAKARDTKGTKTDATVFSAFAAKDVDSDTVHVEMTAKRNGLAIFIENTDITNWFNAVNVTSEIEFANVVLMKKNLTQIVASFKSGFTLTIGVNADQLDITVGASTKFKGKTKGLMGLFNGDPTDDLLPPGENVVPLSNSSSEKRIFDEFGELWRIQKIDSLFYYAPGESYSTYAHTEFQPLFLEDVLANMTTAQRTKAEQTCGDNKECLFDFAVTGKEEAAAATLATNSKNQATATALGRYDGAYLYWYIRTGYGGDYLYWYNRTGICVLLAANASPNITTDYVFNVTVGQVNTLTVTTSDPDEDTVTVTLDSTLAKGATWHNNVYAWTATNMEPVKISFKASDGKGGVAAADVSINLCNCSGHGECLFDLLADGYELKHTFRIVQCNCSIGWEGDHCELDLDGCQDNPCTAGTKCTDLTPSEHVFIRKSHYCSECPPGTEDNDGICLPINECDPDNRRDDCEQICVDRHEGFTCTCRDGYRLMDNGKHCADIDECSEGTSGCEQECTNTDGSYVCSCFEGYTLNMDKTCTMGRVRRTSVSVDFARMTRTSVSVDLARMTRTSVSVDLTRMFPRKNATSI
ncbi:Mucin-like protein [Lamellibrachia satsuma]|nr:Mucin-like protein [Lamellibrachia satsuma]